MAATPHGHEKIVLAGKGDRRADIGHAGAAGNKRGPLVDHAIPDPTRLLIPVIVREEQLAT
jgi:hypothetical protein